MLHGRLLRLLHLLKTQRSVATRTWFANSRGFTHSQKQIHCKGIKWMTRTPGLDACLGSEGGDFLLMDACIFLLLMLQMQSLVCSTHE
jgi:hypothetical protein